MKVLHLWAFLNLREESAGSATGGACQRPSFQFRVRWPHAALFRRSGSPHVVSYKGRRVPDLRCRKTRFDSVPDAGITRRRESHRPPHPELNSLAFMRLIAFALLFAAVAVARCSAADLGPVALPQPPWGRLTALTNGTGLVLLEVRDWPASGHLALPTPFPHITAAHLVNGRQRQPLRWLFNADATELFLELPVAPALVPAAGASPALIELETAEKTAQFSGGRITFSALDAKVLGTQAKLESHPGNHRIGFWAKATDAVSWDFKPTRWGRYDVAVTYSAAGGEGTELLVEIAGKSFTVARPSTGSWYRYTTLPVGRFYLEKSQPFTVKVGCATLKGVAVANLKAVTLLPAPEGEPIAQDATGLITLASSNAITHSVLMRYEPAEKKNCLGYWANPNDWAEWEFAVTRPGIFTVEVAQGCAGGGSKVLVEAGGTKLEFVVENTGHFQNFKPRAIGEVTLKTAGPHTLAVRPQTKSGGAVMDIRQVRLIPVAR